MRVLEFQEDDFFSKLERHIGKRTRSAEVSKAVSEIIEGVRRRGDRALIAYTKRFDGVSLKPAKLRLQASSLESAFERIDPHLRSALEAARAEIETFHKRTFPENWESTNGQGGQVGERFYPLRRVGIYIPGGSVPLVSTVLMSALLAKLAGVPEIAVATPPGPDGTPADGILAALYHCGVEEVYNLGGAQAIAAFAHGTASVPRVDKVFGPGNAFVNEAKRQLFGTVGVDLLPGPSEVCVLADEGARPDWLAADLAAQAEHGSGKELIYLISTSHEQIGAVRTELKRQAKHLNHGGAIRRVIAHGALAIYVRDLDEAARVADFIAPEHLELQVADEHLEHLQARITTAGAFLLGYQTPTVLGDFTAGPSHTLPTGRAGRFHSGLQLVDFMRRSSTVRYSRHALEKAQPIVRELARIEQLDAHGESLEKRLRETSLE
jgi:histidinol dehydrogenase